MLNIIKNGNIVSPNGASIAYIEKNEITGQNDILNTPYTIEFTNEPDETPTFSQETIVVEAADQYEFNLENQFLINNMMVFYNGLLINHGIHYTFSSSNKIITLIDFSAEKGDIITIIGLAFPELIE